ncbi:MAG: SMP-30/gluconolactonase/LRE family protein [Rhodobacter sp.]|nr:SMP-30/gluconolactonase/LRE family protein [Rhodobacter sp.]
MTAKVYDERPCELGEGPLWHPERQQLFWFDILGQRLLTREDGTAREWRFEEIVSAAGWTGRDTLLIASETKLFEFNLVTGGSDTVVRLESDASATRSNDGRADPHGGFWIGTMGKSAGPGAGAIYRYYRGDLRRLFSPITIPNSICFAPDGSRAYFADTTQRRILTQPLDPQGWPRGDPRIFVDLRAEGLNPDGSVTDAQGNLWNAQWGAGRIAGYSPNGDFREAFDFPARHTSCPALGGRGLATLFCTTAREHLSPEILEAEPQNGQTFACETGLEGWPEPRVIL